MAVSGGMAPIYAPGAVVSMAVSAAVTQGNLVEVTGNNTIGPAGAASRKVVGVALQTASASGDVISVQVVGMIVKLKANGTITAGDECFPAAAGDASVLAASGAAYVQAEANGARAVVGIALEGAATTVQFKAMVTS